MNGKISPARSQLITLEYQQDLHFLLKHIVNDTAYFVMRRFIALENAYGKKIAVDIHRNVMQGIELESGHESKTIREFYAMLGGSDDRIESFYTMVCDLRKHLATPDHQ